MTYYFTVKLNTDFESAVKQVTEELKNENFGIVMEIDMQDTFSKKLDINFRKYKILGACNPALAHRAITCESHIGTMLPCNVIVQEIGENLIEISAVDPLASMMAVNNTVLGSAAMEIQRKLKKVIANLKEYAAAVTYN